jgi:hypothetical protein
MLRELLSGITKFFSTQRVLVIVIFLIFAYFLLNYGQSKNYLFEKMEDGTGPTAAPSPEGGSTGGSTLKTVTNPSELLPLDKNTQWSSLNPVTGANNVAIPDLLEAGYHYGINTVGQSHRNANLQLRADPIIEKRDLGPWNQSTIPPDLGQIPFEIGYGSR